MARDFSSDIDKLREDYLNGMKAVLPEYFAKLSTPDEVDVDDMRKAIELGAKVLGMSNTEKVENLPTISWTINGGVVHIEAAAPAQETPVIEVTATEVTSQTEEKSPKPVAQPAHVTIELDPSELT